LSEAHQKEKEQKEVLPSLGPMVYHKFSHW